MVRGGERRRSEAAVRGAARRGQIFSPKPTQTKLWSLARGGPHSLVRLDTCCFRSARFDRTYGRRVVGDSESYVFHGHALASLHVERSGHPPPGAGAPLAGLLISASSLLVAFSRTRASPGGG